MAAARCFEMPFILKIEKGVNIFIDRENYVSTVSSVTAGGFSFADSPVAVETGAAVSAVTCLDINSGLVNKLI